MDGVGEFRSRSAGNWLKILKHWNPEKPLKLHLLENSEKLKSEILSRRSALRKEKRLTFLQAVFYILVGCAGIEPTTNGL
ncbi:hypothetical protein [Methylophilus sp. QUAN]|uniref:hypothetical protein n=1 Tax=Methylophilus sp. QUAN TaxID=2781020 RepID=UPI00188FEDE3|nr:hypothetical protein [Methylophilus sp. QUAN]MBF4992348.1 hypothetical protein [Methylophilus sp. QUAN]